MSPLGVNMTMSSPFFTGPMASGSGGSKDEIDAESKSLPEMSLDNDATYSIEFNGDLFNSTTVSPITSSPEGKPPLI